MDKITITFLRNKSCAESVAKQRDVKTDLETALIIDALWLDHGAQRIIPRIPSNEGMTAER